MGSWAHTAHHTAAASAQPFWAAYAPWGAGRTQLTTPQLPAHSLFGQHTHAPWGSRCTQQPFWTGTTPTHHGEVGVHSSPHRSSVYTAHHTAAASAQPFWAGTTPTHHGEVGVQLLGTRLAQRVHACIPARALHEHALYVAALPRRLCHLIGLQAAGWGWR